MDEMTHYVAANGNRLEFEANMLAAKLMHQHEIDSIISATLNIPQDIASASEENMSSPSSIKHKRNPPSTPSSPNLPRSSRALKKAAAKMQASMATASAWIEENYEVREGSCLPRSGLYDNFVDYCADRGIIPMSPPIFGKIVHQVFPEVKTRRLGTRGQSKYHYDGLAIKDSSNVNRNARSSDSQSDDLPDFNDQDLPLTSTGASVDVPHQGVQFSLPRLDLIPHTISVVRVAAFVTAYQATAQRIHTEVLNAQFDKVSGLLAEFWSETVSEFSDLLSNDTMVYLVCHCDDILYKNILECLGGNPLVALSCDQAQAIREFASGFLPMLVTSCNAALVPLQLIEARTRVAKFFVRSLKTQVSLNRCLQTASATLKDHTQVAALLAEWRQLDWLLILLEAKCGSLPNASADILMSVERTVENLLQRGSDISGYLEWAMQFVLAKVSASPTMDTATVFQQCVFEWTSVATAIARDLTLRSPATFATFHSIKVMIDEYISYLFQSKLTAERFEILQENAIGDTTTHSNQSSDDLS